MRPGLAQGQFVTIMRMQNLHANNPILNVRHVVHGTAQNEQITLRGPEECPRLVNAPLFLQTFDHCWPCGCPIFMKIGLQQAHVIQNLLSRAQNYVASLR